MIPRDTARKKVIRRVLHERFGGGPVLLLELRWRVLEAHADEAGKQVDTLTRSERESFNRTVRVMKDEMARYRIGPVNNIPFGVAAREACMRLERLATIDRLVQDTSVIAALRWVGTATATGALQSPEFSFWTGDPSDGASLRCHGVVRLNNGKPVTFVSSHKPSKRMVRNMGDIPWRFALVERWAAHRFDSPRTITERIYAKHRSTSWIVNPQFGADRHQYWLALLEQHTANGPLSGHHPGTPSGVRAWSTRYQLSRAPGN